MWRLVIFFTQKRSKRNQLPALSASSKTHQLWITFYWYRATKHLNSVQWNSIEYCSCTGHFHLSVIFLDLYGRHWFICCKAKRQFSDFFISFSVIMFVSLWSGPTCMYLFLKLVIWIFLYCRFAISFRLWLLCFPQN